MEVKIFSNLNCTKIIIKKSHDIFYLTLNFIDPSSRIPPISAKFCKILPISAKFGHPPSYQEEKEEEKIPHMCESIGHRPLRGRCPAPSLTLNHKLLQQGTGTADHLTLLRLFKICFS